MKLAMTSLYLPGGSKIGVGYQVHEMANQMVKRGHDVTVFSQCSAGEKPLYRLRLVKARSSLRTFGFAWDLRAVDFSRFDVLHAHGDDWFLWGKRLPRHIHTYHGSCYAEFKHQHVPKEKLRMLALATCEYGSTYLCDERVAVSENTRGFISRIKHVIPNGVDLDRFSPCKDKEKTPTVLFVGTLRGRKRGRLLLKEFRECVLKKVPEAVLWAVCDEPLDEPSVRWFGRVPDDVLVELYRRAWVFCLPSSYEGFGIPYIEAMASGTAVVSTPNAGAVEVLRKGKCGLIVPENRLGKGVAEILLDSKLRRFLEDVGSNESRQYSWDKVCGAYERLYLARTQRSHGNALT